MERVFLDANVLVSAALSKRSSLLRLWDLDGVRLLASPHVLAEARRNVNGESAARLEALIAQLAVLPAEPAGFELEAAPPLPPKDRPVLLAAIVSHADWLLTGDLTHFGPYMGSGIAGVTISLPGTFLRSR